MSMIMPDGSQTVPKPSDQGWWGKGPAQGGGWADSPYAQNQVMLHSQPNPYTYTSRQTNAAYNNSRAQAVRAGDPRFAAKQYQRAGQSSSKGTAAAGAAEAANAYSQGMAQAEAGRMQDAYANANLQLADQVERDRYSNALIGLQEQNAQANWMNDYQSMNNAMGFMGNMGKGLFGNLLGGVSPMNQGQNLLSGLL